MRSSSIVSCRAQTTVTAEADPSTNFAVQSKTDEDDIEIGSARMSLKCPVSGTAPELLHRQVANPYRVFSAVLHSNQDTNTIQSMYTHAMLRSRFLVDDERIHAELDMSKL